MGKRSLVIMMLVSAGCEGSIGGGNTDPSSNGNGGPPGTGGTGMDPGPGPNPGGGPAPTITPSCMRPGATPLRRLSENEYVNTIADMFKGKLMVPALDIPGDNVGAGFANDAYQLVANQLLVDSYERSASLIGQTASRAAMMLQGIAGCPPAAGNAAAESACGKAFIQTFGRRVFRRPMVPAEVDEFVALFERFHSGIDFAGALQLTVDAFLQSPEFLYRFELSQPAQGGIAGLSGYELASRLSFLVWESMPDEALLTAAAMGKLGNVAGIEGEVRRLLGDPRARATTIDFHRQWLEFDRLEQESEKDTRLYPIWSPTLVSAIREESDRFVGGVIFDGKGTLADLLTSTKTEVNTLLARLYGVAAPNPAGWGAAMLPAGERAGFFTRPNFLASHSHSQNGSPPLRGNAIYSRAFCNELPAAPPDADQSNPAQSPTAGMKTNRQLFEERTSPAACAGCHSVLNGFGYGLENYDAIGRFRRQDNMQPVNAQSTMVGTDVDGAFSGPIQMSQKMAGSEQVKHCMVANWFRFAMARQAETDDECRLKYLGDKLKGAGNQFVELVVATALWPEFSSRTVSQ